MAARKADPVEIDDTNKTSVGETLGDQVQPETQLTEDDGNRSLAHPAKDPGPVQHEGRKIIRHPDRRNGENTLEDANEPVTVMRRTSTAPDWFGSGDHNTGEHQMSASVIGYAGASDKYNPDKEEAGLGEAAVKRNEQGRDPAPLNP